LAFDETEQRNRPASSSADGANRRPGAEERLSMESLLFYVFSGLAVVCALLVVANPFSRNPVTSAMFLVLAIGSLAGLFVLLHAFFLAAVQVLVYAGAVMVLFLFVIMLLNLKDEQARPLPKAALVVALLVAGALLTLLLRIFDQAAPMAALPGAEVEGGTRELGSLLFKQYLLPFEAVSVLLLVGMVGVVLLSRRAPK
jgi:NADH-quinone oxidoreductase subunit J